MSGMLSSQCLALATAMAVSAGTLVLLDLRWHKYSLPTTTSPIPIPISKNQDSSPENHTPSKSCLSSGKPEQDRKKKKKKKEKVHFADDVKDSTGSGEQYRKARTIQKSWCGDEILDFPGLPANRKALYDGMLKSRFRRMEFSF